MTQFGDVGEKDAHLAVLHAPTDTAILSPDSCRVLASFGKAAFIDDEHREEALGFSRCAPNSRRPERVADEAAQRIAHAVLVPDSP